MSFIPFTPGGSCLVHLARVKKEDAWRALLEDTQACGMPYQTVDDLRQRGYEVENIPAFKPYEEAGR